MSCFLSFLNSMKKHYFLTIFSVLFCIFSGFIFKLLLFVFDNQIIRPLKYIIKIDFDLLWYTTIITFIFILIVILVQCCVYKMNYKQKNPLEIINISNNLQEIIVNKVKV